MTFGIPHRSYGRGRHRSFNSNYAPRFSDLACWYDASVDVYADDTGSTLATSGVGVALWKDQSANGRHLRQTTSGYRPTYGTDSGYLAVSTAGTQFMTTTEVFTAASTFAVFRSLNATFTGNGAVLGRWWTSDTPAYRFYGAATTFNYAPLSYTRKNGTALTNGGSIAPINTLMLLAVDHLTASSSTSVVLAGDRITGAVPLNPVSLAVCEVLMYTSVLPSGDITDIETMLKLKYGIV